MDSIIGIVIVVIVIMLLGSAFRTNSEPEYLVVSVQPARRGLGCLPFIVAILLGIIMVGLLSIGAR